MGELSGDLTDIVIYYKRKPYIEKVQDYQYTFVQHSEYFNHDHEGYRRNVCYANDYQKLVKVMESANDHEQCRIRARDDHDRNLVEFAMGLSSETGEFEDEIRKHIFQGHGLDYAHLAEELGDIAWFLAMAAHELGYSLSDIFRMNIEKLIKRYPEGFDPERSVNRK